MEIKWCRLTKICRELTGKNVNIVAAEGTLIPKDTRGAIKKTDKGITILLNLALNKSVSRIIETLAHEITHMRYEQHHKLFNKTMKKIEKQIGEKYRK